MAVLTHWEGEPVGVWAELWGAPAVEAHDAIGSTNDRARELARAGAGAYTVVVAEEQTAGRGRSGAAWHSPPGAGLWMSTLLPLEGPIPVALPLRVGLAVAHAVEAVAPTLRAGIKWPNDLEVDGRKLGGILCELGPGCVVVGTGLNVSQAAGDFPPEVAERAASLASAGGGRVTVGALATALQRELRRWCGAGGTGLSAEARRELAARDVLLGHPVHTQQAGDGVARGIDPDGLLLLEQEDGRRVRVVAGSVRIR